MKAVVLVGGEGTRLRPLTETTPKPLLPFLNRPFLHRVLDHLGAHGVDEAILSSPYLETEFHAFLAQRDGGPTVTWITEGTPLGTCGAAAGAAAHLHDSFFVLNGDILTDLDLTALSEFHRGRGAVATIALTAVDDARPFGLVETDPDGAVRAFREKPTEPVPGTVNAGTYVLEPRALEGVPRGVAVSIERETFPSLIRRGEPVFSFLSGDYWRDLGTPESYLAAHVDALEGRLAERPRAPLVGEGAEVEDGASVGPLVVLGAGSRVMRGAAVERSVLHAGVLVEPDAKVEGSILGPGSVVGSGAQVRGAVLGEGARVEAGVSLEDARVGPGETAGQATPS
ncbi:MAG TPA: NDP-sugar synthase [Actinomycetota bacterium]